MEELADSSKLLVAVIDVIVSGTKQLMCDDA